MSKTYDIDTIVDLNDIKGFSVPYYKFVGWYDTEGNKVTKIEIKKSCTLSARYEQQHSDYTYIKNAIEFDEIRKNPAGKYMLIADIEPGSLKMIDSFRGVLDGRGHTLSGWKVTQDNVGDFGLFKLNTGTIKNTGY